MYQINLTETEWQYITKVLNLQERKRKFDLRIVWNAIFYLVKTGLSVAYASQGISQVAAGLLLLS
jgi:hypothetical protein